MSNSQQKVLNYEGLQYFYNGLAEQFAPIDHALDLIGRVEKAEADVEALKPLDVQPDWKQTDETAMDFIKNKPDEDDALEVVSEIGLVEPVTFNDGSICTDENGAIFTFI